MCKTVTAHLKTTVAVWQFSAEDVTSVTEWLHCVHVLLSKRIVSCRRKRHNNLLVLLFVCSLG